MRKYRRNCSICLFNSKTFVIFREIVHVPNDKLIREDQAASMRGPQRLSNHIVESRSQYNQYGSNPGARQAESTVQMVANSMFNPNPNHNNNLPADTLLRQQESIIYRNDLNNSQMDSRRNDINISNLFSGLAGSPELNKMESNRSNYAHQQQQSAYSQQQQQSGYSQQGSSSFPMNNAGGVMIGGGESSYQNSSGFKSFGPAGGMNPDDNSGSGYRNSGGFR